MANYSILKAAVQAVVKTNGNQEITGANMQSTLISIINSLGTGYQFIGVATPSTSPGTPDYNVAYIGGAGTYANFGTSMVVPPTNIAVFKYNGTWTCEQVTVENGGVFDISAFHAVGGTLATYADLAAALGTGGANVPEGVRKGGMSIKFVQSSDNKYVQYFLTKNEWSIDPNDWEKINLKEEVSQLGQEVNGATISYDSTSLTDGAYINADNGEEVSNIYRSRTGYIELIPGTRVNFNCYGTADPQGYALYDESKNYLSGQEYHNAVMNDVSLVVPDVHYIRITCVMSTDSLFSSFYLNYSKEGIVDDVSGLKNAVQPIPSLMDSVESIEKKLDDISISYNKDILTDGAYIDASNGSEVFDLYRSRTDFIEVTTGATVTFTVYGTIISQGFALYDANKNYVSGYGFDDDSAHQVTMLVPNGVKYIRITWYVSSSGNFNSFSFSENKVGIVTYVDDIKSGVCTITDIVTYTQLEEGKYYQEWNGVMSNSPVSSSDYYCAKIPVKAGDIWRIYGVGNNTVKLVSTTDSGGVVLRQYTGKHRVDYVEITIAEGETYIYVNLYEYNSNTDKVEKIIIYTPNELESRIEALENELPLDIKDATRQWFWKGKKVVVFGDSITEFRSIYSGGYGWLDRFAELSGALIYNGAIGGSRMFARRATVQPVDGGETSLENSHRAYNSLDVVNLVHAWVNNSWSVVDTNVEWLKNNVSDDNTGQIQHLKDMPIANTEVVIISAGGNDWHNGSVDGDNSLDNFNVQQVYGALNNIVKDILSTNPKIQIYFLTPVFMFVREGAPAFSDTVNYEVGDLVKHSGSYYVFEQPHSVGSWNASEVRDAVETDFRRDECSSDVVMVDGRTLKEFSANEISFVHKYHLPIVDMYNNLGFNKYNYSNYYIDIDNTHPFKGFIYFGEKVFRLISCL